MIPLLITAAAHLPCAVVFLHAMNTEFKHLRPARNASRSDAGGQPLVLPPPSSKTFGQKLARLIATARRHEPKPH